MAQATRPARRQFIYPSVASCSWQRRQQTQRTPSRPHGRTPGRRRATGRRAAKLAREIGAFAKEHGGAEGQLAYIGQAGARIVLVGQDGAWGDLVAPTYAVAESAAAKSGITMHDEFDGEFALKVRTGPYRVVPDGRDPGRRPLQRPLRLPPRTVSRPGKRPDPPSGNT